MLTGRLSLALDVLAAMFLFVVALMIVAGVIAGVIYAATPLAS
jgi:hypothetical protein